MFEGFVLFFNLGHSETEPHSLCFLLMLVTRPVPCPSSSPVTAAVSGAGGAQPRHRPGCMAFLLAAVPGPGGTGKKPRSFLVPSQEQMASAQIQEAVIEMEFLPAC